MLTPVSNGWIATGSRPAVIHSTESKFQQKFKFIMIFIRIFIRISAFIWLRKINSVFIQTINKIYPKTKSIIILCWIHVVECNALWIFYNSASPLSSTGVKWKVIDNLNFPRFCSNLEQIGTFFCVSSFWTCKMICFG